MACLDTSVLLDLCGRGGKARRQRAAQFLRDLIRQHEPLTTTRFNVAELYVGVARSTDAKREHAKVQRVLEGLEILEFDDVAARLFGQLTAHLQVLGRPAGDMDVLIASVALAAGHSIVTGNPRHFADLPEIDIRSYE